MPRPVPHQAGEDLRLQDLEGLRITEEGGDVDEHVLEQGVDLGRARLQELRVVAQVLQLVQHRAPADPPQEGAPLVVRKVHAGGEAQLLEHLAEAGLREREPGGLLQRTLHVGVSADARQLLRDGVRRQHEIHAPGRHRAGRHARVLRARVLRERDAALALDGLETEGAVGGAPRQDHPDGPVALVLGQRVQEVVDGAVGRGSLAGLDVEGPPRHRQAHAGRDHVDVIGPDGEPLTALHHRHRGGASQDLGQHAGVRGIEVLDQDERQPGIGGQRAHQRGDRLEPSRGGSDADDGDRGGELGGCLALVAAASRVGGRRPAVCTPLFLSGHQSSFARRCRRARAAPWRGPRR